MMNVLSRIDDGEGEGEGGEKTRWSNRARVVLPLDEGPEIPITRASLWVWVCSGMFSSFPFF